MLFSIVSQLSNKKSLIPETISTINDLQLNKSFKEIFEENI